jgi:hypothetical protein
MHKSAGIGGDGRFGPATTYVVHAWNAPSASLLDSVIAFAESDAAAASAAAAAAHDVDPDAVPPPPPQHFFWIDLLSVNQHVGGGLETDQRVDLVSELLTAMPQTVVVLYPLTRPAVLTRKWCVYEIQTAIEVGAPVCMPLNSTCPLSMPSVFEIFIMRACVCVYACVLIGLPA